MSLKNSLQIQENPQKPKKYLKNCRVFSVGKSIVQPNLPFGHVIVTSYSVKVAIEKVLLHKTEGFCRGNFFNLSYFSLFLNI